MKILFRPHRGSLSDSMRECVAFDSYDELKSHLIEREKGWGITDFSFNDHGRTEGADGRIDWPWTGHVMYEIDGKSYVLGQFTEKDVSEDMDVREIIR